MELKRGIFYLALLQIKLVEIKEDILTIHFKEPILKFLSIGVQMELMKIDKLFITRTLIP